MADHPEYEGERFAQGLENRRAVLGAEYVDESLANADEFMRAFQQRHHRVVLGRHLGPAGAGPQNPLDAEPGHADRAEPLAGTEAARARRAQQRRDARGDQGGAAARDRVLRHPAGLDAFKTAAGVFAELDRA